MMQSPPSCSWRLLRHVFAAGYSCSSRVRLGAWPGGTDSQTVVATTWQLFKQMTHVVSTVLSQDQAELSPRPTHTGTHLSRYLFADRRTVVIWDVADLCSTKSLLQGEASLVAALVSSTSAWTTGQRSCSSSARSQVTGPPDPPRQHKQIQGFPFCMHGYPQYH
jgi:hypothetical protein